ncbi:MAG: DUF1934 domain-containing protein [Clostridia bacterium]|nr:DUF1934 domain-containing protein [Clostridia bacterium]
MKEENTAVLEIKSVQDGVESMLLISDVRVSRKKHCRLLEFDGTEICGVPGEVTSFKIYDDNNVELTTTGRHSVSSSMTFEEGVKQHCHYTDAFNEPVEIGFSTNRVRSVSTERGGKLEIDYFVEFNNVLSSRNSMKLTYKFNS